MKKVVIFGTGKYADQMFFYLKNDSPYEVAAFTVDGAYLREGNFMGLPVVAFEEVQKDYPLGSYDMFIAVGYHNLNKFRAEKYSQAKVMGYKLISYVNSRASNFGGVEIGDNCLVLENVVIQPLTKIGNDVFIWSGNHIGHHAQIGDHCYIAGQVMVGGSAVIETNCFIGMNATIGHEVIIGRESFIGAGAMVTKNAPSSSVYIAQDTPRFRLDSNSFLKLTKMK